MKLIPNSFTQKKLKKITGYIIVFGVVFGMLIGTVFAIYIKHIIKK